MDDELTDDELDEIDEEKFRLAALEGAAMLATTLRPSVPRRAVCDCDCGEQVQAALDKFQLFPDKTQPDYRLLGGVFISGVLAGFLLGWRRK